MHIFIALLFTLFGAIQYNDPDFYIWMPIYFSVAGLAIGHHFDKAISPWALAATILFGIGMISYLPDVVSWINNGLPSITGSMKAESPFVEFIREFFGLFLCFITSLWYWMKTRNLSKKKVRSTDNEFN